MSQEKIDGAVMVNNLIRNTVSLIVQKVVHPEQESEEAKRAAALLPPHRRARLPRLPPPLSTADRLAARLQIALALKTMACELVKEAIADARELKGRLDTAEEQLVGADEELERRSSLPEVE